jgi:type II secretory pathway pseudopilin PulG
MNPLQVSVATDWLVIAATIISGIFSASATLVAVIYSNKQTKAQLKQQEEKFAEEREEQYRRSKYVVIMPSLILASFNNLLDRLIVQNDYNRVLLFSGNDGFDFFDDTDKRSMQLCRLLQIDNRSESDIVDIEIKTETILQNKDSNEKSTYATSNYTALLRAHERIAFRLANQHQYESIIKMNAGKVPHDLQFDCSIVYTTPAKQRIKYHYEVIISNDKRIEIVHDGIEKVENNSDKPFSATSPFRNLQDYISSIDRSAYSWEKMAQAQVRGMQNAMLLYSAQSTQQSDNTNLVRKNEE